MFWRKKKVEKYNLKRFKDAQDEWFLIALDEISRGHKECHWIWYIFPQLRGLGQSEESYVYGIANLDEAMAYMRDGQLHDNLIEITKTLFYVPKSDIKAIVGSPDDMKIRSCMTLFYQVADRDDKLLFRAIIDKYYDGMFDDLTLKMLNKL